MPNCVLTTIFRYFFLQKAKVTVSYVDHNIERKQTFSRKAKVHTSYVDQPAEGGRAPRQRRCWENEQGAEQKMNNLIWMMRMMRMVRMIRMRIMRIKRGNKEWWHYILGGSCDRANVKGQSSPKEQKHQWKVWHVHHDIQVATHVKASVEGI